MTNIALSANSPAVRRLALEAALASRGSSQMSVDELLTEAQKIVTFVEHGTVRSNVTLTFVGRNVTDGLCDEGDFCGIIFAVDETHRQISLEGEEGVRMIVQPERWDMPRYMQWLQERSVVYATGMPAWGLPLLMRATVELFENPGGAQ